MIKYSDFALSRCKLLQMHEKRTYKYALYMYIVLLFVMFYGFEYNDLSLTTNCGIKFWNCLLNGKIREYYLIPESVGYGFLLEFIFAIWNLPLWIINRCCVTDVINNPFCIIYSKTIVLIFLMLTISYIGKICTELGVTEKKISMIKFLFISSLYVVNTLCIISQYDIISVAFLMISVYHYIKNDSIQFLFFMAIAVNMKFFPLMAFAVLAVRKQKNIWKLFAELCISMFFVIAQHVFFYNGKTMEGSLIWGCFCNKIQIMNGDVPVYLFFEITLVIACYLIPQQDEDTEKKMAIYLPLLSYSIFFISTLAYPYWIMYMVPFVFVVMAVNYDELIGVNIMLETISSFGLVMGYIITYHWIYSSSTATRTWLWKFANGDYVDTVKLLHNYIGGKSFATIPAIGYTFFSVGLILFLYINFSFEYRKKNRLSTSVSMNRFCYYFRLIIGIALCGFVFYIGII